MPDRVLEKIISFAGFQSLLTLRKTCQDFRVFVDESFSKVNCTSISLDFRPDKITFISNFSDREDEEITYRKHENGCVIQQKLIENADFVDSFFEDFQLLLNFLELPLPRSSLKFEYTNDETDQYILSIQKKIKTVLESRSSKFQVEKFIMNAFNESQVLSILPFLDSKFLKEIWILDSEFWLGVDQIMEINEVVKLAQWKSARQIVIRRCIPNESVQYFSHFKVAFIAFFMLNAEDVETFKKVFLQSKSLKKLRFEYANFNEKQQFFDNLGPPSKSNSEENWYFKIQNTDKALHISHNPQYKNIVFTRIELSSVPKEIVSRD
uniref:F-box domain-containing protein n=1 Tax=Caenorhabditis tropicalis TaxID=1561998 RepID=A0A1I7ULH9_9PELO